VTPSRRPISPPPRLLAGLEIKPGQVIANPKHASLLSPSRSISTFATAPSQFSARSGRREGGEMGREQSQSRVLLTWVRGRCFGIKAHSTRSTKGEGQQLQGTGRRPAAIAGTTDSRPSTLERYDESAFCCSRVGHAACQPDLRSDRQQSDMWRLRLGTKLPLLWCESITWLGRGLPVQAHAMARYAAGPVPAA
jgi:hypothetical protein